MSTIRRLDRWTSTLALLLIGTGTSARAQVLRERDLGLIASDAFGWACAAIGDVDGDGIDDFIVGSPNYDDGAFFESGRVVVYSGATGAAIREHVGSAYDGLGSSVAAVGDVDMDGVPDYIVGAPYHDDNYTRGMVVVYSGSSGDVIWTREGTPFYGEFGSCVSGIGDVDGDGESDVVVGSQYNEEVYVLGHLGATIHRVTAASGTGFGIAVAGCGDLDGDGVRDFVAGSPWAGVGPFNDLGAVTAFSGAGGTWLWTAWGTYPEDKLGTTLASLGDVSGDGIDDVLAGSPSTNNNNLAGVVRVINGSWGGTLREQDGDTAGEFYGWSICGMGDVNGDGVPDYAVGARQAGSGNEGRLRICSGSDGATIYEWYGVAGSNGELGGSVASGDWNGDGVADLLSGDWAYLDAAGAMVGSVDVLLMAPAFRTNYGAGWAGKNGIPTLIAVQDPVIGAPLDLQIGNSLGASTNALLFLGVQSANLALPGSGTLLVSPLVAPFLPLPPGGLTLSSTLPNDPSLAFLDLYLQALELDPFATKGISFTPGLQLHLGFDLP